MLLAYGVAQVAGTLPIVPGGIGIVEGSLAVILAAYGAGRVPAVAAALAYRLVSFWLSIAVGWIAVALIITSGGAAGPTRALAPAPACRPGTLSPHSDVVPVRGYSTSRAWPVAPRAWPGWLRYRGAPAEALRRQRMPDMDFADRAALVIGAAGALGAGLDGRV